MKEVKQNIYITKRGKITRAKLIKSQQCNYMKHQIVISKKKIPLENNKNIHFNCPSLERETNKKLKI